MGPLTNAEVASEKKKEQDHEEVKNNLNEDNSQTHNTTTTLNALEITEDVTPKATSSVKSDVAEVSEDFDLKDATKDLKETVTNIEAKCAGVREELGQMAMSEQYMRTKQAQLLAKREEKVLEKRSNVVEKVNKVLDCKLRKADFVQKQRDESLAFANDWLRDESSQDTAPESSTQKMENEVTQKDKNSDTGVEESP